MPNHRSDHLRVNMAAASDVGSVRKENEDFYYYSQAKKFFIVCDGMGGHQKGALASKFACETLSDILFANGSNGKILIRDKNFEPARACKDLSDIEVPDLAIKLIAGIRLANRRILLKTFAEKRSHGMGTTILAACALHDRILIAHVGDSRLYRLREGALTRLTSDHSWLNELIEDNEISRKEAENFNKKNVLTRALGMSAGVKIDLQICKIQANDLFLLCTDGLYNALPDDLLVSILSAHHGSLQNKVNYLVDRGKMLDGSDNITAGLIYISGNVPQSKKSVEKKLTLPDGPQSVSEYLDSTIKDIYPVTEKSKGFGRKQVSFAVMAALSIIISALFLYYQSFRQKKGTQPEHIALFSDQASTAAGAHEFTRNDEDSDYIVLVQVGNTEYTHKLRTSPGYNILEAVPKSPADLSASLATSAPAVVGPRHKRVPAKHNPILQTGPAVIHLVGDFDSPEYIGASIYIDDALYGSLDRYKDSGFQLGSGLYTIKIVNPNKTILQEKTDIEVQNGETIAIQF